MSEVVDMKLLLPWGWWVGYPEFLRDAGRDDLADRMVDLLAARNEHSNIVFEDEEVPFLAEFLRCKTCRSWRN